MKKYGYTIIGRHVAILLRVKLTSHSRTTLRTKYSSELLIRESLKGYTMIEGCLKESDVFDFRDDLKLAKLDSKVAFAVEELSQFRSEKFRDVIDNDRVLL